MKYIGILFCLFVVTIQSAQAQDSIILATDKMPLPRGEEKVKTFYVDESIEQLNIKIICTGPKPTYDIILNSDKGQVIAPNNAGETAPEQYTCNYIVNKPTAGEWKLSMKSYDNALVVYEISGTIKWSTFEVSLKSSTPIKNKADGVSAIQSGGQSMILQAEFRASDQSKKLTGVNVKAVSYSKTQNLTPLEFRDDGVYPDRWASDGVYTAKINCENPETYHLLVNMDTGTGEAKAVSKTPTTIRTITGKVIRLKSEEIVQDKISRASIITVDASAAGLIQKPL